MSELRIPGVTSPHLTAVRTEAGLRHAHTARAHACHTCTRVRGSVMPLFVPHGYVCLCCSAVSALGATPSPACPCLLPHLGAWPRLMCCQLSPFGLPAKSGAAAGMSRCRAGFRQLRVWGPRPPRALGPSPGRVCAEDPRVAPANVPPLPCAH